MNQYGCPHGMHGACPVCSANQEAESHRLAQATAVRCTADMAELKRYRERELLVQALLDFLAQTTDPSEGRSVYFLHTDRAGHAHAQAVREFKIGGEPMQSAAAAQQEAGMKKPQGSSGGSAF